MAGLGSSLRRRGARCLAQREAPSALLQCRRTCVTSTEEQLATTVKVHRMIRLFREQGHCIAKQDPLGRPRWTLVEAPELALLLKRPEEPDLAAVELSALSNRSRVFVGDELPGVEAWWTVGDVIRFLHSVYCSSTGVEYTHIADAAQQRWWREQFERTCEGGRPDLRLVPPRGDAARRASFELLLTADRFEHALKTRFPAAKRFGLEGCEALIPGVHALIARAAEHGLTSVEVGTSHRGRLNLLHGLMHKHFGHICAEFADDGTQSHVGDVRYHLGTSCEMETAAGRRVHLSLSPNPSHLEAVNPVVLGRARAKQVKMGDRAGRRVMPLLLHGDAAFAGQGLVAEAMQVLESPLEPPLS